ncbi:MAG TPA: UDP-N-acetylmuramoyl-tripeptide--D-alanyl-D-alanine ligase [Candidatus Acidoferrum sp.]|nr:UDP-N-acetylmuramoyl-tripeptide--D-alanyl-D-alanine ligase [Candidatus Acidoferrum sp.]
MIEAMRLSQLQAITGGELHGSDAAFSAVSTDTRSLQPGDLFVALKGPNFNGNAFVETAAAKQAGAAVVSEQVNTALPYLQVDDTRIALGRLGRQVRRQSHARIIALTGSQGKTTVKEMTTAILQQCGAVLSTQGNLNNDYGVPLTLLRLQPEHEFAVIEMGANAPGEIAYTTALAEPDVAHITCVAPTHVEGFGSLDGVATAKSEIWQGLREEGVAVLNLDDGNIMRNFMPRPGLRVVTVSASGKALADYRIEQLQDRGLAGTAFELQAPQGNASIELALPGRHNAANALAAAALALEAGATLDHVKRGLQAMHSVKGRLVVKHGLRQAVILDDTYNASPASFKAAIDVLAGQRGIRFVAAGDMGELGPLKVEGHREVGAYAKAAGIEHFYATGPLMQQAVDAFGVGAVHAPDWNALGKLLQPLLRQSVSVLVKGSRSAGMERVVDMLVDKEG